MDDDDPLTMPSERIRRMRLAKRSKRQAFIEDIAGQLAFLVWWGIVMFLVFGGCWVVEIAVN